jgi:hypothetical protein
VRARRRLEDKFSGIEANLSDLQAELVKSTGDWRYEVSTLDQNKDTNYRPAFLKDIMDKYSWDADAIAEAYATLKNAPLKIELSSDKLAALIFHTAYVSWLPEFTTAVYNSQEFKNKIVDFDMSPTIKIALKAGNWMQIKNVLCQEISQSSHPAAEEVNHRYLLDQAMKTVKLKPRKELERAKEEAEQAKKTDSEPNFLSEDVVREFYNKLKQELEGRVGKELSTDEVVQHVLREQEEALNDSPLSHDGLNEALERSRNDNSHTLNESLDEESLETEANGTTDQDTNMPKNDPLVNILDMSNQVASPYKNLGGSPSGLAMETFLSPGRPMNEMPSIDNPLSSPSPDTLKMQYM